MARPVNYLYFLVLGWPQRGKAQCTSLLLPLIWGDPSPQSREDCISKQSQDPHFSESPREQPPKLGACGFCWMGSEGLHRNIFYTGPFLYCGFPGCNPHTTSLLWSHGHALSHFPELVPNLRISLSLLCIGRTQDQAVINTDSDTSFIHSWSTPSSS